MGDQLRHSPFLPSILAARLALTAIVAFAVSSCKALPEAQFVRERIPVEIQIGKPVIIKIRSLSGNGSNEVGIPCSPETLQALTGGKKSIDVRLLSSSKKGTRISNQLGKVVPFRGSRGDDLGADPPGDELLTRMVTAI